MSYRRIKPVIDFVLSMLGIVLLSPLLALISAAVLLKMGRPVFYCQWRAGLHGEAFRIIKFRTMLDIYDADGNPLPDRQRLTSLGTFLRRASLDELPELVNVLRGEMSLVGPRPLYVKYLGCYTRREMKRHEVRPGITGWAQVHGRNLLPWDQRLALDAWYVENQTLALDMKILVKTVAVVLSREGASADPNEVEIDLDHERGMIHGD